MNKTRLAQYWPLITLVWVAALAGYAFNNNFDGGICGWMHGFMGVFLTMFATLKLFNPKQFADGFAKYDLLAKRSRGYGYLYPYIELVLALAYLSFFLPALTYLLTISVFGFGSVGVISALRMGLNINCPCMGSILQVPLSTVTLTEDISMVVMALIMLVTTLV